LRRAQVPQGGFEGAATMLHSELEWCSRAGQPLVTALINTYNYGRYLPYAINSVLNQTYPIIEIIVVDDGSTDHTEEVLAQYTNVVQAIRTENGGQAHSFNVGFAKARGELIMLLDADDAWLPEKVERMVQLAAERPKAAMLYHRYQNVEVSGRKIGPPDPDKLIDGDYRTKFIRSGGSWWNPVTSVLTLRAEHIKRALPFPTYGYREGADSVVTDYCAATAEIASTTDVLALRRLHGSNLYAAGRDGHTYRSKAIREADVRKVDWRIFSFFKLMRRLGYDIKLDANRNEWRVWNLYWLGRASLWQTAKVSLLSPAYNIKERWTRLRWVMRAKRMYRADATRLVDQSISD
jgi:glycosyltransferase involved in cell wall biosynthesis